VIVDSAFTSGRGLLGILWLFFSLLRTFREERSPPEWMAEDSKTFPLLQMAGFRRQGPPCSPDNDE